MIESRYVNPVKLYIVDSIGERSCEHEFDTSLSQRVTSGIKEVDNGVDEVLRFKSYYSRRFCILNIPDVGKRSDSAVKEAT
ncbi:MAG: hypothetical protein QXI03_01970 [Candidatus Bathyarchaeia archaeon]